MEQRTISHSFFNPTGTGDISHGLKVQKVMFSRQQQTNRFAIAVQLCTLEYLLLGVLSSTPLRFLNDYIGNMAPLVSSSSPEKACCLSSKHSNCIPTLHAKCSFLRSSWHCLDLPCNEGSASECPCQLQKEDQQYGIRPCQRIRRRPCR